MNLQRNPLWLITLGLSVYAFLYIPLATVVLFSFNASQLNAEWVGFTTLWYQKLFTDSELLQAALNSLLIAISSSLLSTILGTLAALTLIKSKGWILSALTSLIMAPVAIPEILLGVSLLLFFRHLLDITLGIFSILISHIVFSLGFVALIVRASLIELDKGLFEAAQDCGAGSFQTFRWVTFPLIFPSIVSAFLVSFTLSIDDFVITFFVSGVGIHTLPLEIYSMVKVAVTPEINAISTLMTCLTVMLVSLAHYLSPNLLGRPRK